MKTNSRLVLFLLFLIMIFLNADQMIMAPNIGEIEAEFKVADSAIGAIQGAFTIIGAGISLLWGYWADKFSRKRLILLGILVGEIPCFLSAFTQNYEQLFVTRALTGIGVGAMFPVVFSFASDTYREEQRANVNALLSTAFSIGAILGMVVAGYMGGTYGWRAPFIVASLPNVVFVLIFYFLAKEPQRGAAEVAVGELVEKGFAYVGQVRLSDYLNLFKIRTNLILFIQGIMGTIPWGAIPFYLIYFLESSRGISKESATTIFVFFGLGNVVGIFAGGLIGGLLYKKRPSYMPLFCGITTGLGTLAVLGTLNVPISSTTGSLVVLGLLGFAASALASMTGPNMKTMLMNINEPENRGRIFSVFNLTDSLGAGVGQSFGGTVSTALGSLGGAMNISALFWLPCAAVLMVGSLTFPRDLERLHKRMHENAAAMRSARLP